MIIISLIAMLLANKRLNNNTYYVYIAIFILLGTMSAQSIQDLQRLKLEYEKSLKGQTQTPSDLNMNTEGTEDIPRVTNLTPYSPENVDLRIQDNKLKHFGYDFFTRRDSVPFLENLPLPANYLLGAGDELIISLWGETQLRKTYIISREGKIYDDKVGLIYLTGKTIFGAQKYLTTQFGRVYATLNGKNPSTYMNISLGELRSINVNFVGELKYPGVYPIHPFSSVITGLIQSGGVDTTGSLRNIKIIRDGNTEIIVDLYNYLLKGDLPSNIQLRDQDIVLVPVKQSSVVVDSAVARPGVYESQGNETIKQLIDYAGGLKFDASSSISLKRIVPMEKRKIAHSTIENYYIDYSTSQLAPVQNGDIIVARTMFSTLNQVELIGQVKRPGLYHFYPGMKLIDLINLGVGSLDTTYLKSIYQGRGELVRRNPLTRYESVIEVNLKDIINGTSPVNIPLQNLDRFIVHANINFFEKDNVQILGEVNIAGSYSLISDNETLNSLLNRAGGLTSKALKNGISIYRDKKYFEISEIQKESLAQNTNQIIQNPKNNQNLQNDGQYPKINRFQIAVEGKKEDKVRVAWKNESITLMPGDSVVVKESTGTVNLSGEIYNPGLIEFRNGKSLNYYVNSAGGITNKGNKRSIIVIYANGVVKPKKWYSSPRIEDGATIIVNQKPLSEPFNTTQFASNFASILSSIVTTLVLSRQL